MNPSRLSTYLHCIRLTSLITAVVIVIGSLCLYSSNSLPLSITDDTKGDNQTWIIQSITDRRLISTLVAAQASIFCPLFILLNPSSTSKVVMDSESSSAYFVEIVCQVLMPLGLAFSWMFSILFDLKTTELMGTTDLCLLQDKNCILFGFIHGLKHVIVVLFVIETTSVSLLFVVSRYRTPKIQLPLDEEAQSEKI